MKPDKDMAKPGLFSLQEAPSTEPEAAPDKSVDKQIEELTKQVVSVLDHGDKNQARMAIRAFISRIEVEHGKPVQGTVYYTYSAQKRGTSMVPPGGFEPPFWP